MPDWPQLDEPELLQRLAMGDREFREFVGELLAAVPARPFDEAVLALALSYPWERPQGSYLLSAAAVEPLEEMAPAERERVVARFSSAQSGRLPVLAIGSNASPEALERKFAHFPGEADRTVLALTGRLHEFDVGVAAQPALYGAMPATLFPSPGTAVVTTVLWVTPAQFTQLTWSELTYRLGRLQTPFEADDDGESFDEVLVFVSRFGSFCVDGEPVALAAIPAEGRTAIALTQEEMLDTAATLALGGGATAETLVRAIFEELDQVAPRFASTIHREARPFASERWTPFSPPRPPAGDPPPRAPG